MEDKLFSEKWSCRSARHRHPGLWPVGQSPTYLLYQPVGSDLRLLCTVLKVNNDLERIADHATNIAEDVIFLATGEIVRHRPV